MSWVLRHKRNQGGCGGVAFKIDYDPQEMRIPKCVTSCWSCGDRLQRHHWRLRNFEEGTK